MRFGVALPNNQGVEDAALLVALAREAEDQGFDSVWVSDHLFHASYVAERLGSRPYHEPLTILTAAAATTGRVSLGTSVLVLPWHHPVRLAKTLATLDQLSGGRLIVGVGVGVTRDEFAALGVSFADRGRIADEMLGALRALWTQDVPEYKGEHLAFSGLRFEPKPLQSPHPPLWIGGDSPAALRRLIRAGDGWHPLGLSPGALARALEGLRRELAAGGRPTDLPVAVRLLLDLDAPDTDRPADERRTARGSPAQVLETLRAYARAGATSTILDPGTGDPDTHRRQIERFCRELAPELS